MKSILVLLANCHGKNTRGKRSPDGRLREYAWGREINKRITEELYKYGIKTVIINPEENEVKLSVQAARANNLYHQNKNKYDDIILVSPHINASAGDGWTDARGFCCFVYNKASSKSRKLARIISDIAYDEYNLKGNRWVPEARYFEANYAILRDTCMPAILTECGFQTNHNDVDFLLSEEGKKTYTLLHVKSILNYMNFYGYDLN